MVFSLLRKARDNTAEVEESIINFFTAFDDHMDERLQRRNRKLEYLKGKSTKVRNQ